jgi:flagellar motor switch protein FliM
MEQQSNNTQETKPTTAAQTAGKQKGIELLVDKALQSSIRLPMLDIAYDRFIRINSTSLRNFTSDTVDIELVKLDSRRFGEYLTQSSAPSMLSVFKVLEWDNFGLMVIDGPMIYSFVEVLLGGRKTEPSLKVEGRPFTSIESGVVKSITELILHDLGLAFNPITPATFQLDRIETNPKFAMVARPEDIALVLNLKVIMESRTGNIDIILPYSTIEPVKKILAKSYIGERGSKDPSWMRHFEHEINNAHVKLEIVLDSAVAELKDVASFKVGKTIILEQEANTEWDVRVNNVKISTGVPGKVGDSVAIKLSDAVNVDKYKE